LDNHSKGIQTFSHEKHYILSSELKHLYVAVTRARQHLWIFDEDPEFSEPIRIFWDRDGWNRDGLIKVIQSLEELSTLPTLVKKSSSHEWNRKGKLFFERRQYELVKIILFN
jgi:ATP-dependent exoDNAse (exonuclease V) beta subunit